MENTVSEALNEGLCKIKHSQLLAIVNCAATHCVCCLVPLSATEIMIQEQGIRYIDEGGHINSVDLFEVNEDYYIVLNAPLLSLYIVGDLAYYADMQGKHKTCSNWCNWCKLSRKDWQWRNHTMKG